MTDDEFTWDAPTQSYRETFVLALTSPREFFSTPRAGRGLQAPVGFLLISLALGALGLIATGHGLGSGASFLVGGFCRVTAAAALCWLVASKLFSGRGTYEDTFRALAYASAVDVFALLPGLRVIAALYGMYVAQVGLELGHRMDSTRATLTLLVAAAVAAVLCAGLGVNSVLAPIHPIWLG